MIFIFTTYSLTAATYYVDTGNGSASDSNNGSSGSPWKTINKAAATAAAGDTVNVKAGEYNEFITNSASGTSANPITFTGERGSGGEWLTIIDPSTTISNGWIAAPEIGTGVFKLTNAPFVIGELTITNKRVAFVYNIGPLTYVSSAYLTNWTTGADLLAAPSNAVVTNAVTHLPITFWDGIEALYYSSNGIAYLRLRDGSNPNGVNIRAAPNTTYVGAPGSVIPAVNMNSKNWLVWSNFKIRGAIGCFLCDGQNNLMQSNYLAGGYERIGLFGNSNTVSGNEITTDYYGYSNLGAWTGGATGSAYAIRVGLYSLAKYIMGENQQASYDYCVAVHSGASNNIITGNHIFQSLGVGVSISGDVSAPITGTQVISNSMENHTSIGLLLSEGETLTSVHGNYFGDSDINVRFHHINVASELSRIVYFYRNTSWLPDNISVHIFLHGSSQALGRYVPQFYTYQNSFSGGIGGVQDNGNLYPEQGMTNSQFINNIFNCKYYTADDSAWVTNWMGTFDYNLICPPWPSYPSTNAPSWFGAHNIVSTTNQWANGSGMSFVLPKTSQAVDAGLDLTVADPTWPTLGTKVGSAWDIGALEWAQTTFTKTYAGGTRSGGTE